MVYSSDFYTSRRPAYYKPSTSYSISQEEDKPKEVKTSCEQKRGKVIISRVPWHKVPDVPRPSQVEEPFLVYGRHGGPSRQTGAYEPEEAEQLIKSALRRRHLHVTETIPSKNQISRSSRYGLSPGTVDGHESKTRRRIAFSSMPPLTYRYYH